MKSNIVLRDAKNNNLFCDGDFNKMKRIAIIGAGLSGIVLGHKLFQKAEVIIFEKAKGIGGRMSTRYASPFVFDHGVQSFTSQTPEFQNFLSPFKEQGVIGEWQGKILNLEAGKKAVYHGGDEALFVAIPNMNSLLKSLASSLDIRLCCEVSPLGKKTDIGWLLRDSKGENLGNFDWVISTAPPVQTRNLFATHLQGNESLNSAKMQSCYVLMLGFSKAWDKDWIGAKVGTNGIKWIAVNSSKPGRDKNVTCLIIYSTEEWAQEHIDCDIPIVQQLLITAFENITGIDTKKADYISTHRWRYATAKTADPLESYINIDLGIAAIGDWVGNSQVEHVWLNAQKFGDFMISKMNEGLCK